MPKEDGGTRIALALTSMACITPEATQKMELRMVWSGNHGLVFKSHSKLQSSLSDTTSSNVIFLVAVKPLEDMVSFFFIFKYHHLQVFIDFCISVFLQTSSATTIRNFLDGV